MKKILTLICTLLCANVLMAQTRFWFWNLQYEVTSTNPAKVEVYDANSSIITANIPETVTYQGITYSVRSIGYRAFYNCSSLTSVRIPNSVTSVDACAFYNCSSLTSVTIPNSVTSIGGGVFKNCSSLTSVTLSNNITELPWYYDGDYYGGFFEGCSSLTSVTIPNSVTSIGASAFANCSSLTSITIPNSVTSIGGSAFYHCDSLTSITIPNSVTSIGAYAFSDCSSLTSVTIPNSVTSIGEKAFWFCSSLTSVTIPNSVTSIGNTTFCGCISLTSVTIPNSVTSIGENAFNGCSSLTSITIGNGVTSIGEYAFWECNSLTSVTCLRSNSPSLGGSYVFFGTPNNKTLTIPCGCESAYTDWQNAATWASIDCLFTIGDLTYEVTSETEVKVQSCTQSATSVVIPETVTYQGTTYSVTSIGDNAFEGCSSLTSMTIEMNNIPNLSNIGLNSTLQNLTLGENVTSIASGAFNNYSFLQNVTCLANTPPTLADNTVFPYPNIATLTVPCGTLEAYSAPTSFWNFLFAGRISENRYNVVVTANDNAFGSVAVESDCSTATLTATASDCYQFVSWNDGNTDNPRIISFTSDTSLTAIFEDLNTELIVNICEGQVYTENNFNVSEAGVYTQNLTSVNGCDSIVTLTLNVNPIYNTELTETICQGQAYTENGFNVSEAGVYTQTLTSVNGCDSIVTLTLNVNPIYNTELTATICQGQTYTENNFNVSEAGVYTQTLTSVNGCDSIVTLTLNVNPTFDTIIYATINSWETYMEHGFNESEAGTYVQNLQTVNGCDSTITLNLTVNSSLYDVAEFADLSVYPNPTRGKVTFNQAIEKVEVIDLSGKILQTYENANEINIEALPAGVYHLRMTIGDKTTTRKVIKE